MPKGWFTIPGHQTGHRSLEEQLLGLDPLVAEVEGKSVADFGCAEGLIMRHLKRHGAAECVGYENNIQFFDVSKRELEKTGCEIRFIDLNVPQKWKRQYDVVLLLAILHKLEDPQGALRTFAGLSKDLVVIRLPFGSDGEFGFKHKKKSIRCDSRAIMTDLGFALERDELGPREERVHYWRRMTLAGALRDVLSSRV